MHFFVHFLYTAFVIGFNPLLSEKGFFPLKIKCLG